MTPFYVNNAVEGLTGIDTTLWDSPPNRTLDNDRFWEAVRPAGKIARPEAWAFGATVSLAEKLLSLVLDGTKTSTAGALWDYEAEDEPLPVAGQLNIILDGSGAPHALVRITSVRVVPFNEVDAEHAWREGEGDRSLEDWQEGHERFFTEHQSHNRGFADDMPVVLECFELLYPLPVGTELLLLFPECGSGEEAVFFSVS